MDGLLLAGSDFIVGPRVLAYFGRNQQTGSQLTPALVRMAISKLPPPAARSSAPLAARCLQPDHIAIDIPITSNDQPYDNFIVSPKQLSKLKKELVTQADQLAAVVSTLGFGWIFYQWPLFINEYLKHMKSKAAGLTIAMDYLQESACANKVCTWSELIQAHRDLDLDPKFEFLINQADALERMGEYLAHLKRAITTLEETSPLLRPLEGLRHLDMKYVKDNFWNYEIVVNNESLVYGTLGMLMGYLAYRAARRCACDSKVLT